MYIELSKSKSISLTKQIYKGITDKILSNELKGHERLPSTRALAKELGVSRIIIVEVYEQLLSEGFVYSRKGSGTFISDGVTYKTYVNQDINNYERNKLLYQESKDFISFRPGVPDLRSIPIEQWVKTYSDTIKDVEKEQLDYHNSFGSYELRETLATYLQRVRGVKTGIKNIMITNGVAQAMSLLRFLLDKDDYVLIENPSSVGLQKTLETNGMKYKGIEVDGNGLMSDKLPEKPPKLIFTTPSHQFPTGVILPIKRRIDLINYARKHNIFVVEDDYDSEFRFCGNPIQSLQSIEPNRTIYLGTFSKIFSPAIRMGYMILPVDLIHRMEKAKYGTDIHSPIFEQLTMSRFIKEGYLEKHVRKMNKIYASRRNLICALAHDKFADQVNIKGDYSGLHLILSFKNIMCSKRELAKTMTQEKLDICLIEEFRVQVDIREEQGLWLEEVGFIIGYGNVLEEDIVVGMNRLEKVISCFSRSESYNSF